MKRGRGRRKWLMLTPVAVLVIAVIPLHFAGNSSRSRALLLGLERRYGAGDEQHPVYIEGGPAALSGLTTVGRQPVEVVSRADLITRYAGKEVAPELATVTVQEEHDLLGVRYVVTVQSFGFRVPSATTFPWGGSHLYYYRQWGGLLWEDGKVDVAH